jgi:transposase
MYVKITTSGPRRYVQLVESFRNEEGKVKKRTIATLGRLDQVDGALESVISGLLKLTGKEPSSTQPPSVTFESARSLGDVWALQELWSTLGFSELARTFRKTRHTINVEALIRVMVFNRLCDPESKLGVLRWLETVAFPDLAVGKVTHDHLLRSMDALVDHRESVDRVVAGLLRPLIDQDLSVVFYDLTTIRAEGLSEQPDDVRKFGMAKEGIIARQFMLGVVQTAEGLPIYHEVFEGNTAETKTLLPTITTVLERFPSIRRLILIADRGLLSLDNLGALSEVRLAHGKPLEFILAVPGRRYGEFTERLHAFHADQCGGATQEVIGEVPWNPLRLVIAHDPVRAAEQTQKRRNLIKSLVDQAEGWAGKLEHQDQGARLRGRKLSDSGAKARFYHAVSEAHLSKIIRVDLKSDLFAYDIDEAAQTLAEMMDGKLLLVTNAPDLTDREVVQRYKSLADIERGFRVLKSELNIGPVYHRLPERIRAHAALCFMALILYRVMRLRLKAAQSPLSPERVLDNLSRIQHHRIKLNGATPMTGISTITDEQAKVFTALNIKKPVTTQQLTLL